MTNTTEEFHPDRLRGFSYFFVCFSCVVLSVLLLLLLVLVAAAHGDKAVRRVGLTFLCYLVVGAMCGQGFLISHGVEALRVSQSTLFIEHGITTVTWADCHAQSALLVSMLAMLAIPLMAKSWRVYSKIRTAETHRLHLWDATAQRLTALQLFVIVGLVIGHLIWSSYDNAWDETRTDCVDETQSGDRSGDTATVERYLYFTQTLIIVLVILPFPYLLLQVTSSSFAAIFPSWPYLLLSVLSTIFCAGILAESFYTEPDSPLIKLFARQGGVQALTLVVLWAWVVPALRLRLREWLRVCCAPESSDGKPKRRSVKGARRSLRRAVTALVRAEAPDSEAAALEHRDSLQRQATLEEYMARLMGEKLLEHQHRLASLRLRLNLLNTPRQAGPPQPPP